MAKSTVNNVTAIARLKKQVDKYGRKNMAAKLKMSYHVLSHKLGGFAPLTVIEKERIEAILSQAGE